METCLRNGKKKTPVGEEEGRTRVSNSPANTGGGGGGGGAPGPGQRPPLQPGEKMALEQVPTRQPTGDPVPELVDIPEGAEASGEPTLEQGESMRGKEQQRETARY